MTEIVFQAITKSQEPRQACKTQGNWITSGIVLICFVCKTRLEDLTMLFVSF